MGNLIDGRAADRAADKKFVYLKLGLGKILGRAFSSKSNKEIFSSRIIKSTAVPQPAGPEA